MLTQPKPENPLNEPHRNRIRSQMRRHLGHHLEKLNLEAVCWTGEDINEIRQPSEIVIPILHSAQNPDDKHDFDLILQTWENVMTEVVKIRRVFPDVRFISDSNANPGNGDWRTENKNEILYYDQVLHVKQEKLDQWFKILWYKKTREIVGVIKELLGGMEELLRQKSGRKSAWVLFKTEERMVEHVKGILTWKWR